MYAKRKPEKKIRLERDSNLSRLRYPEGEVLYQLSNITVRLGQFTVSSQVATGYLNTLLTHELYLDLFQNCFKSAMNEARKELENVGPTFSSWY